MLQILIPTILMMQSAQSSWIINGENPRLTIVGGANQGWKQGTFPFVFGHTRGPEGGVIIPSRGELRQLTLCAYEQLNSNSVLSEAVTITPTINGAKATDDYVLTIPMGESQKEIYFQYGLPVSKGDHFNIVANTTNKDIHSATVLVSFWMDSNTPPR